MEDPSADELVGRLTLADAMLGEVVTDMRRIVAYANWPESVYEPAEGLTTSSSTRKLEKELGHEAGLATSSLTNWIAAVMEVVDRRDRVVHAIALNQCMKCGDATMFRHPRSGEDVDRSPHAVQSILDRYHELRDSGLSLATQLSMAVNRRIEIEARAIADATDEIQNPPQIYPQHVEHLCAECSDGQRGHTRAYGGTAISVLPPKRWEEFRAGAWPLRET